ncbi:hypothetical protein M2222_001649 [Bradyrhizobium elkanii]|uniref:hypothetical protein n=1 Tax=Bradyrhizobium elkanii TaxID=29448 RepID=UPI0021670B00|nr:hypothetical protein [Bradyrhizobium elkanii]MCS3449530.1 hypothetical protein [Bradyrhizobium elkanii]MCS3559327.1 hypothetical protein [Bradyrhizobium elkanii]MCW2150827.1 hypothetical protein [Bradyrhizobium elkanii]MCW2374558.1 hypothetical protein [Bradyrhizobium elkanii]
MKTTLGSPADSAGALYFRTDISPEQIFQAIWRLRREARDEIDRLLRFLDETDNHMELEPEDEDDDAELEEGDPAEDDGTAEPSLGSLDCHHSQELWAAGDGRDLEQDLAESGIADLDGLLEQVGTQDWQQGAMA